MRTDEFQAAAEIVGRICFNDVWRSPGSTEYEFALRSASCNTCSIGQRALWPSINLSTTVRQFKSVRISAAAVTVANASATRPEQPFWSAKHPTRRDVSLRADQSASFIEHVRPTTAAATAAISAPSRIVFSVRCPATTAAAAAATVSLRGCTVRTKQNDQVLRIARACPEESGGA